MRPQRIEDSLQTERIEKIRKAQAEIDNLVSGTGKYLAPEELEDIARRFNVSVSYDTGLRKVSAKSGQGYEWEFDVPGFGERRWTEREKAEKGEMATLIFSGGTWGVAVERSQRGDAHMSRI